MSPKNGFLLEPSEPLHLEYALAHPDATVRVELVSYDPFARAELGEKEARLTVRAAFNSATPKLTNPPFAASRVSCW